jgi:Uma2 family endonuclease
MVQTELTLDDLEQMPDDGMHRELIDGELIELPPAEIKHSKIARTIFRSLDRHGAPGESGELFFEAGYKVTVDKRNWVQPDLSFVNRDRYLQEEGNKFFSGAPDLAVEVISPSERPKHILAKREVLFRAGCREIWIVRPKTRKVEVWTPQGPVRELVEGDTLSSPLFAGWSMPVSDVFA